MQQWLSSPPSWMQQGYSWSKQLMSVKKPVLMPIGLRKSAKMLWRNCTLSTSSADHTQSLALALTLDLFRIGATDVCFNYQLPSWKCSIEAPMLRWERHTLLAASCILFVRAIMVQLPFFAHTQALGTVHIFSSTRNSYLFTWLPSSVFDDSFCSDMFWKGPWQQQNDRCLQHCPCVGSLPS